jgi:site-specific DNA recombinase
MKHEGPHPDRKRPFARVMTTRTIHASTDQPDRKRAAIYTRVSTDEQAREGYSLDEQEHRCRELIQREGWQHIASYRDAGYSGSDPNRPDYRRLLTDAAAGMLDVVVLVALDRFGRDAGELRAGLLLLDAAGTRLVSTRETIDRTTPEGRLQTGILSEFAEFEREKIKARTSAGIASRARQGKPWGAPGYGYRKGSDGDWIVDAAEESIARRIDRDRVEHGMAYNAIANMLNREAVPTRTGGNWTATQVRKVVTGRYRLGEFWHGGEWIKGSHPPIQSEETWLAAQALAAKGDSYGPSRGGRKPPLHLFINGLLRCSECFEAMLPRGDSDKYRCRTRAQIKGGDGCSMPNQPREVVDEHALAMFERTFLDLEATRAQFADDLTAHLNVVQTQQQRAAREVSEKAAQIARIESHYLMAKLSAETYERLSAQLTQEHAAAESELARLSANAEAVRRSRAELDAEADVLRRLADLRVSVLERVRTAEQHEDVAALRAALAQAFSAVYVGADGSVVSADPRVQPDIDPLAAPLPYWEPSRVAVPFTRRTTLTGSAVPE